MVAGITQSCKTEIIEIPSIPVESYKVITVGEYSNGKYQIPAEGITYISKGGVAIYYCENRRENGEKIYEEIYSPRNSIGGNADWNIDDTVKWIPMNPHTIVKIEGSFTILE